MTQIRLSASSYSNTAPLVWSFLYGAQKGMYELIMDNAPARSAELMSQGQVTAALVPVIEFQRIPDLAMIPDVCVGASQRVESVCLVTDGCELSDVSTVALDTSSRTSATLTRLIFQEFLDTTPDYRVARPDLETMLAESDCALLIGDPALTVDETKYRKFDLAAEWHSRTGLGFIFAVWMTHISNTDLVRTVDFKVARDEGVAHIEDIIANYEDRIQMEREDFRQYLSQTIRYQTDEEMVAGMELYFALAQKHGITDTMREPTFI